MSRQRQRNPFIGKPGLGNAISRVLFPIIGPASLGPGNRQSRPVEPREPALCTSCRLPYADHTIIRGTSPGQSTRILCETPE